MSEKNILDVRHAHVRKVVEITVLPDGTKTIRQELELLQVDQSSATKVRSKRPKKASIAYWFRELTARITRNGFYRWLSDWLSGVF